MNDSINFEECLADAKNGNASAVAALLEPYNQLISDLIAGQIEGAELDPVSIKNDVLAEICMELNSVTDVESLERLVREKTWKVASTAVQNSKTDIHTSENDPKTEKLYGEIRFDPETGKPLSKQKSNKTSSPILIIGSVLVIGLIAAGIWWFVLRTPDKEPVTATAQEEAAAAEETSTPVPTAIPENTAEAASDSTQSGTAIPDIADVRASNKGGFDETARNYYEIYSSYLNALNHDGDFSLLKNTSSQQTEVFRNNYSINACCTFELQKLEIDRNSYTETEQSGSRDISFYVRSTLTSTSKTTGEQETVTPVIDVRMVLENDAYTLTYQNGSNDHNTANRNFVEIPGN